VSWQEANEFCRKLTNLTEKQRAERRYRLPTEAEWEYACRAGSMGAYCFGNDLNQLGDFAWYSDNSGGTTQAVGTRNPNDWDLYDLHGNVWEWCQDWYDKNYYNQSPRQGPQGPPNGTRRVLRGGSWKDSGDFCRSARRNTEEPGKSWKTIGFRVVCDVPRTQ